MPNGSLITLRTCHITLTLGSGTRLLTVCNFLGTSRFPVEAGDLHYDNLRETRASYTREIVDMDPATTTHQRAPERALGHYLA